MTLPVERKVFWITGASSGIGAALAEHLAYAGHIVAASARSADKLAVMAERDYGAGRIVSYPLDVTDRHAQEQTLQKIYNELGPLNAVILNAGTYYPDHGEALNVEQIRQQFELNVFSVIEAITLLLPRLRQQKHAQIALVASVAGYSGLPRAVGYGGSKAALINIAEALKLDCDALGVKLQLICPGFVKTSLTDKNKFHMPFLIEASQAAAMIVTGLESDRFEIVFPWPMAVMMKFLRLLPYPVYFALLKRVLGAG